MRFTQFLIYIPLPAVKTQTGTPTTEGISQISGTTRTIRIESSGCGNNSAHYKDNKWVAGYNPLNEPTEPKHVRLVEYYNRLYDAIRKIDAHHILFLDGNTFASDFTHFSDEYVKNWENTSYSIHDYSRFGFPGSSETYAGGGGRVGTLIRAYEKKGEWLDQRGLCVWDGEWGPVYAEGEYEGDATEEINKSRIHVLKDQLTVYNRVRPSSGYPRYFFG